MISSSTTLRSIVFLLCLSNISIFAQGPGGIGDATGTNGPRNVIWLDASTLSLSNGDDVTTWGDISGNGFSFGTSSDAGSNFPDFLTDGGAGFPSIEFDDSNEERLIINPFGSMPSTEITTIMVFATANSGEGIISYSALAGGGGNNEYLFFDASSIRSYVSDANNAGGAFNDGADTYNIFSSTWQSTGGTLTHHKNSTLVNTGSISNGGSIVNNGSLVIGGEQDGDDSGYDAAQDFGGRIAEIIMYSDAITAAERIVVENYLADKYGLNIGANDFWSNNVTYSNNLAGIGQESSTSTEATTASSSFLRISESADMDDDDWLFWGHDNGDILTYTTTEVVTGTTQQRLAREWIVNETNDLGNVTVSFSASDLPSNGVPAPEFYLLVDSDGDANFDNAASNLMTLSGGNYEVTLDLAEGDHLAIAYVTPNPSGTVGTLSFWFNSDNNGPQNSSSAAVDGSLVDEWVDISSNGYDAASSGNDPVFDTDNALNFHPVVSFDGTDDYLTFDMTDLEGADYTLMGVVRRSSSNANQYVFGSETNAADALFLGYSSDTQLDAQNSSTASTNALVNAFDSPAESPAILAINYNSTNLSVEEFRNGGSNSGTVATGVDYAVTGYTGNLGRALAGNYFNGDIVELFAFSTNLSTNDYNATVSNLAIKYGIDLGQDYVDEQVATLWDLSDNSTYTNDVTVIGYDQSFGLDQRVSKNATDSIVLSTSVDFTSMNSAGSRAQLADGQYAFISNDDDPYTLDQSYNGIANSRTDRTWRYRELGATGTVAIAIPTSLLDVNQMLVSSDPTFASGVAVVSLTPSGSYSYAQHDFADGDYFTFASDASEIWYSYLSGDWDNPINWTLDGAISAAYVNPSSKYPTPGDSVVIKSGRTITANVNNITVNRLELQGTLDLGSTTGQDFTYIEGSGTLLLSGAAGVDNYPAGVDTLFHDATEGGRVEYYGTGFTFNQTRRFNDLILNFDNSTARATMTGDSIYVFGSFDITQGFFQFNDNSSTNNLAVAVHGNLNVSINGSIDVGTADARHELNLHGDFTNQGNTEFTNRASANFGAEATDGIVDVNFVSSSQDQTVDLQNTTVFYRVEINKGVDDTYKVSFSADDPSYFSLFGFADEAHGSIAQLTENDNALGLIYGTIEIGSNVQINELSDGGNYNVSEGASIRMNGGTLIGSRWIVAYGSVISNSGAIDLGIGTVIRNSGFWEVNGGTIDMGHFRTSGLGAGNDGSWTQTGGIVNLTGSGSQSNYYTFSLTYQECSFTMTGGEMNLTIGNAAPDGYKGIFLNSATENTSVTGGTITIDQAHTETDNLLISSTVPFYNLILKQSVANANPNAFFSVSGGNSGGGSPDGVTLGGNTLQVLNDLIIDNTDANTTTVDFDGNDVDLTGNLVIQSGAVTDFTEMTLRMNGLGSSDFDIQLASTLVLDSLEINKNDGVNVNVINGQATAIQVDNYLNIAGGNFNIDSYNITANGNINIADTIGTSTSTGIVSLLGNGETVSQTITASGSAFIYDVLIDNDMNIVISGGDIGFGSIDLNDGIVDIGVNQVTINSPIQTTGTFGADLFFQTAGNPTDGGLSFLFDEDEITTYPFGIAGNYTPLVANIDTTNNDIGYVRVNPVNSKLGTLDDDPSVIDFLNYYWKVELNDFVDRPRVNSYVFTYNSSDVNGTEGNLQPGFVDDNDDLDNNGDSFSRFAIGTSAEVASNEIIFTSADIITADGSGLDTLRLANYTAAEADAFAGSVTVFYSRRSTSSGTGGTQAWTTASNWSTDDVNKHEGEAASSYPGENSESDIVVMGFGAVDDSEFATCNPCTIINTTRHDHVVSGTITVAEIIFDQNPAASALNNVDTRIRVNSTATLNAGRVTGRGTMFQQVNTNGNAATITADFNEFNENPDNGWFLQTTGTNGGTITISDRFEFPTLRVFGQRLVSYTQPVITRGLVVDNNADLYIDQNFTVNGTTQIGLNQGGEIIFGTSAGAAVGSNVTFETDSIVLLSNASSSISVADVGTDTHTLRLNGGIDLNQAGVTFDLHNASTSNVTLELSGVGSNSFENTSGNIPELSRLVIDKGVDTTNVFTMNTDFDLNGANTSSPQSLELQNGKLILNNSAINVELADNSDFSIPSTAGLEVTQGTVTATGANVILGGLLRINGGAATLASTDIEYTSTGTALIDVTSGVLNVGGQVRRSLTSSNGVLKFHQSGGDVDIATDLADNSSRAAFEVLNVGSELILTGGTFNIERGVIGDANESLELDPATFDLTGSTITLFENLGANYGANFFNIKSAIDLNGLNITNTINLPDARVFVQPLSVNNLEINTNQVLNANSLDVTINGNFTNAGTYTNTASNTIFAGSGAQSLTGAGTFTIFDLTKSGSGTTILSTSLTLTNDLRVNAGILDMGSNTISLKNDAYIESTLSNTTGNGLIFNGTSSQNLFGLSNNTVALGTVTVSNPIGLDIPDGNGYNFDLTQNLRLAGGVFNIGGSLVTMKEGSTITAVSPFSISNMVQTNSSFTDNGFVVEFLGVDSDTTIFYPVGELKYTPVSFDLSAGTTAGSIRVRPANEIHPTIVDNVEPVTGDNTEIDDTQNILNYYWVVVATGSTGIQGEATFFYNHEDILATQSDTSNFISGRILSNNSTWDKFLPTDFKGASQSFVVPLGTGVTFAEITGDYTAGLGSTDGLTNNIEGSLPDELAQYETTLGGVGNYSLASSWSPLGGSPAVTDGVGPVGAQVIVRNGDDLTLNVSNIRLFSTEIESGGILRVPAGVTGVRLGNVTGSGTIVLTDTELLPTGEYSEFLACDGGALQYSGSTNYSVLSGISQIRKVTFDGTGTRTMPNNNLSVCDTLLINGPTVTFNSGRTRVIGDTDTDRLEVQAGTITLSNSTILDVAGDFIMSGGSFTGHAGTGLEVTDDVSYSGGALNWNGTDVTLNGTTEQLIDGSFTGSAVFDDLTINNSGSGVTVNSGDIEVSGILTLTDGLVNTSSSETLTLTSSGDWTGASSASYITGPLSKQSIPGTSTFEFPVGKSVRYAPASVVNVGVGGDDWTAEYFTGTSAMYPNSSFDNSDPGSGFNALISVQVNDRWEIASAGSNTAQVRTTYGSHTGFDDSDAIRLVWWDDEPILDGDAAQNRWENQGGQVSGTVAAGTVTSESAVFFSTRQFAMGRAPESVLPVELLDFSGEASNGKIVLKWVTASELNNDFFDLQHSLDGKRFESIGIVQGNGTTNELIEYQLVDNSPALGLNYYRLRQVDYDGSEEFHSLIQVNNDFFRASLEVTFYPNPATIENMNLKVLTGDNHTPISIKLMDLTGKIYYQNNIDGALLIEEKISPSKTMVSGIYFLIINQGSNTTKRKIIIR